MSSNDRSETAATHPTMTRAEHIERHKQLHSNFDELVADWILHTHKLPSKASIYELMQWAYQQTINPTEENNER